MDISVFFSKRGTVIASRVKHLPEEVIRATEFLDSMSPTNSQRVRAYREGVTKIPACSVCGGNVKFTPHRDRLFYDTCSQKCAARTPKRIKKIIESTDYAARNATTEATNLARYGKKVKYNFTEQARLKGLDNFSQSQEVKDKIAEKRIKNSEKFRRGAVKGIAKRIENENWFWRDEAWMIEQLSTGVSCEEIARIAGVAATTIYNSAKRMGLDYYWAGGLSSQHQRVVDLIDRLEIKRRVNVRDIISPMEIDVFVPEKNLAIEVNGLYWHRDHYKSRTYHLEKQEACERAGIRLVQLWCCEIDFMWPIVESVLVSALGKNPTRFGARECRIVRPTSSEASAFLEKNHLQGRAGASLRYGLERDGQLVQVMTFGKPRYDRNHELELIRLCSELGTTVVGGAEKIFSAMLYELSPESIVSYSSRRLFTGRTYEKIGFTSRGTTPPNQFWFLNKDEILTRDRVQKHKLPELLDHFDPRMTADDNLYAAGYSRIWDSGNYKFSWRR